MASRRELLFSAFAGWLRPGARAWDESFARLENDRVGTLGATLISVESVADLAQLHPDSRVAFCLSHAVLGDNGGGHFYWDPTSNRPPDGAMVVAHNQSAMGRWVRNAGNEYIDVCWFGARGDGKTDDSNAIESAFSAANAYGPRTILFPPGHYLYKGQGVQTKQQVLLRAIAPNTAVIDVQSDAYFVTCLDYVESTFVSCLTFVGGRGAFRFANSSRNVSHLHVFEHCRFEEYTECAIGNNSVDHPYLKVSYCIFKGDSRHGPIGIAWGGYIDTLNIQDCAFLWNKYHIKLGPRLSGSVSVRNNDFIKWTRTSRAADIWIVPNSTDSYGVNSGLGLVISENKFGNENQLTDEPRIIVALEEENPQKDRLSKHHSDRWVVENVYLQGLSLDRNRIEGVSGLTAPIIRSYIQNVLRLNFTYNFLGGGAYTYLCEFKNSRPPDDNPYTTNTWNIELGSHAAGTPPFTQDISNQTRGPCRDPFGTMQGSQSVLLSATVGDDVGFVDLLSRERHLILDQCQTSIRPGFYGSPSAIEITYLKPNASLGMPLDRPKSESIAWLECDIRRAEKASAEYARVRVLNSRNSALSLNETVALRDDWQTIRIPFVFASFQPGDAHYLQFLSQNSTEDARPSICIDRINLYHGRQAMNGGHLRTLGSGSWNEQHIVLGGTHIWLDNLGQLRTKSSAPTSEHDGLLVGHSAQGPSK